MGCFVNAIYWLVKLAFLFSAKAAMPSFWSAYKRVETCISASLLLCVSFPLLSIKNLPCQREIGREHVRIGDQKREEPRRL